MKIYFEHLRPGSEESFLCRRFTGKVFDAPYHFHPEAELTYIVSSRGRRFVGDSVETYGPGDFVLVAGNLPHRWAAEPARGRRAESLVAQFSRELFDESWWERPEMRAVARLLVRGEQGLAFDKFPPGEAQAAMETLAKAQGARRFAELLGLLERLAGSPARTLASTGLAKAPRAEDAERIQRVQRYLEERYTERVHLDEVARLVSLTPAAFSRFFARATGTTFVKFVTDMRLSQARRALAETGKSVTEICFECGFGSLTHFHAVFRAAQGTTPRGYRRKFESSPGAVPARFD